MLSESVLIAIFAFIVLMCHDHRKWRKTFTHTLTESSGDYHTTIQEATDHLAFIADMIDDGASPLATPAPEGMPALDPKAIITQALISKLAMGAGHGNPQEQVGAIHSSEVDPPQETEV